MKRVLLAFFVPVIFLGFTGCGGGGDENPQPGINQQMLSKMSEKEKKELQAQLSNLQMKFGQAQAACQQSFGPAVQVALQQGQTSMQQPANQDACFTAVQNFLLTYKTVQNGQYAASAEGQAYIYQTGPALLNAIAPNQQVNPAVAASLALPAYSQFMNSLDPSLRGAVSSATNPYLATANGAVTGTTTTTTTTVPGAPPVLPSTGIPAMPVLPTGAQVTTDSGYGDFQLVY